MTRINVVPVTELTDKHLLAEYREIMRLPNNLKTTLARKGKPFSLSEIPNEYTLGKGHVKFFYNKFQYLLSRYIALANELLKRQYDIDMNLFETVLVEYAKVDFKYFGDYMPDNKALAINRHRINERLGRG
jgi:deoxyribonuclease (pyrimidine dimer)